MPENGVGMGKRGKKTKEEKKERWAEFTGNLFDKALTTNVTLFLFVSFAL